MKRKALSIIIATRCWFLVVAVLGPTPASSVEAIKLRLSNALAPGTFQNVQLLPAFAKEVKERTGGNVTVELYPGGQLYGHIETAEALHRGSVEMGFLSVNHWVGYHPFFDAVKAWGGVPAAMSPSEMYDALAKGTLAGALTGWESVEKRKLYEVT